MCRRFFLPASSSSSNNRRLDDYKITNKALKAFQRPARHPYDIDTFIYNELCRLPQIDAPFEEIKVYALDVHNFLSRDEYFKKLPTINKKQFLKQETIFIKEHGQGETFDCLLCYCPLWDRDGSGDEIINIAELMKNKKKKS
eukprot:UN03891